MHIQYLQAGEIDKMKWDRCIATSHNGLIYAYSMYLDCMARQWDALVLNDYEVVMPLTWNKKYGFYYLYQPFLCACLGIFGKHVDSILAGAFLRAVPRKFKYWDIYLNHGNLFPVDGFDLYQRTNHVLALNRPYSELYQDFRPGYRQLLKRFSQMKSVEKRDIAIADLVALAKSQLNAKADIDPGDYERFIKLYGMLKEDGKATNYGIYSTEGELLASGAFLFSHNRAYYILAGNHPNGRTLGASHQMINCFIRDHAERDMVLDFEGSDIRNIAFFFQSFGAIPEKYPGIRFNRLPPLLRWLKE